MCRSPSGPHQQLHIVCNSYNLVRVLRRQPQPLSLTQESHVSTPSGSAPSPPSPLSSIVSHFTLSLTRDVRTQTVSLCSVPTTQPAATALYLGVSAIVFYQTPPSGAQFHFGCMKTIVMHRPPATLAVRGKSRLLMPPRSSLSQSSSSGASSPEPCRRVPSPAPLCFKRHLLRLPHIVPLSQMHPPKSRPQRSFLGASPMTRWIDSFLFLRMGTLVAPSQAHGYHSQFQELQWW